MGFYKSTDQAGQALNVGYAEDVGQLVDVLTGQRDAGALTLLAPLSAPAAPSVSLSAGGITGTGYQWAVYWITGILDGTGAAHVTGRTPYGTLTAGQALTAQEATVSVAGLGAAPTGAIGWGVARNKSGGGTWYTVPGSEQFMTLAGTMPASFVDNVTDASLVSAAPTANTTGTSFSGVGLTALYDNTIQVAGTWDVQNIAQTYKHLLLVWSVRFVEATKDDYLDLRLNNDSGATSYTAPTIAAIGGTVSTAGNFNIAKMYVGSAPGSSSPAGRFGAGFIFVPNYASATPQKTVVAMSSDVGDDTSTYDMRLFGGVWKNTAAANRIQLFCDGGAGSANIDVGSRLTIYGMP